MRISLSGRAVYARTVLLRGVSQGRENITTGGRGMSKRDLVISILCGLIVVGFIYLVVSQWYACSQCGGTFVRGMFWFVCSI